jgi:electron transfer flavoprotein alpha subunit
MEPGILAICLPQRGILPSAAFEMVTAAKTLAEKSQDKVFAVVIGAQAKSLAQDLVDRGMEKVFVIEHPSLAHFNDELYSQALENFLQGQKFEKLLIAGSISGKSLASRLSARIHAGLIVDAFELSSENGAVQAKRALYSGNAIATISVNSAVSISIVQPMLYAPAERIGARQGEIISIPFEPKSSGTEFISYQPESSSEIDLGTAERIISGGRGLGNAEGFKLIEELAKTMKAAVGASRAAVDAGWIPYRHQVGLTGKTVHPKLYMACGISGQIQHLAGMSSSGTIAAINTDPECPMMKTASLSIVGDIYEIIPLLIAEIKKRRGQ